MVIVDVVDVEGMGDEGAMEDGLGMIWDVGVVTYRPLVRSREVIYVCLGNRISGYREDG